MISVPLPTTALIAPAATPAATIASASSAAHERGKLVRGRWAASGLIAGSSLRGAGLPEGDWESLEPSRAPAPTCCRTGSTTSPTCARSPRRGATGCWRWARSAGFAGARSRDLVCPDDFIALDAEPRQRSGPGARTGCPDSRRVASASPRGGGRGAGADARRRRRLLADPRAEARDAGRDPADRRARRRDRDDDRGRSASSPASSGSRYAAVCVVDNFANGVGESELTLEEIEAGPGSSPGGAGAGAARSCGPALA